MSINKPNKNMGANKDNRKCYFCKNKIEYMTMRALDIGSGIHALCCNDCYYKKGKEFENAL